MNNPVPPPWFAARLRRLALFLLFLFLTTSAGVGQTAQIPDSLESRRATASTGAIAGRVVSEDGGPLSDVLISLFGAYARVPGPPQTATTDSEGRFNFPGLAAGLYTVRATLPGFNEPEVMTDSSQGAIYRPGDSVYLTLLKGGVITGTVTDANGDAVVAVAVRAVRVRDASGRVVTSRYSGAFAERMTDDRGIYRIYGLPPGTYVVSTGNSQRSQGILNPYEGDAPTFFPSSTRDTAAEVPIRRGEESTGIDIRYRGERGQTISGKVSGSIETKMPSGVSITLRQTTSGGQESTTFVMPGVQPSGFSFSGVADGEYDLMAQQWGGANESVASVPRRVTVKGADVTGIELTLAPLSAIAGRINLEAAPKEKCGDGRGGTLQEIVVNARREEKSPREDSFPAQFFSAGGGTPTDQGEFTIRNLLLGNYRLTVRLPSDAWYVRSIGVPAANAPQATAAAKSPSAKSAGAQSIITLKAGERVTNVAVQIAQDAAGLRGKVGSATDDLALPADLRVYLVPQERERVDDSLRYSETGIASDGAFSISNLAPGRYWIIARPAPESDSTERRQRPLSWDAEARTKLRREAETANMSIELQPCQHVNDYALRFAAPK